ncbi:hypothetical protein GGI24_002840 [Coemansia furcata]|nr:hypothetical protein GGI24_002840 [Coemansia furcata]
MAGAVTVAYSPGQQNGIEVIAPGQEIEYAHHPGHQGMVDDAPTTYPELMAAYSPGKHTRIDVNLQRPEPRRVCSRRAKKAEQLMTQPTVHPRSPDLTATLACAGAFFLLGCLVSWLAVRLGKGPAMVDCAIDAPESTGPVTVDCVIDSPSANVVDDTAAVEQQARNYPCLQPVKFTLFGLRIQN